MYFHNLTFFSLCRKKEIPFWCVSVITDDVMFSSTSSLLLSGFPVCLIFSYYKAGIKSHSYV